jgi:hypothetical protein
MFVPLKIFGNGGITRDVIEKKEWIVPGVR